MSAKPILTEYNIEAPALSSDLTITLVSDLHERKWDDLLPLIKESEPDIIAIAGDTFERYDPELNEQIKKSFTVILERLVKHVFYYINKFVVTILRNTPDSDRTYEFFREISKIAPVVMSAGNHEEKFIEEDYKVFNELNISLLENSDKTVSAKGEEILFGGLSSLYDENWLEKFSEKDGYKVLLCHHPIYFDRMVADKDIDLVLAGHNHGGQIRIKGKGILSAREGILPKYDKGVFDNRLVVSAGCANTVAMPRINNPREIVKINLVTPKQ
jgi:predicted MPP superfamily phosphohydrolase